MSPYMHITTYINCTCTNRVIFREENYKSYQVSNILILFMGTTRTLLISLQNPMLSSTMYSHNYHNFATNCPGYKIRKQLMAWASSSLNIIWITSSHWTLWHKHFVMYKSQDSLPARECIGIGLCEVHVEGSIPSGNRGSHIQLCPKKLSLHTTHVAYSLHTTTT